MQAALVGMQQMFDKVVPAQSLGQSFCSQRLFSSLSIFKEVLASLFARHIMLFYVEGGLAG